MWLTPCRAIILLFLHCMWLAPCVIMIVLFLNCMWLEHNESLFVSFPISGWSQVTISLFCCFYDMHDWFFYIASGSHLFTLHRALPYKKDFTAVFTMPFDHTFQSHVAGLFILHIASTLLWIFFLLILQCTKFEPREHPYTTVCTLHVACTLRNPFYADFPFDAAHTLWHRWFYIIPSHVTYT